MSAEIPYRTLMKDGVSQSGRVLNALDARYFQPDERGVGSWLVFIEKLASVLPYASEVEFDRTWKSFANYESVGLNMEEILLYLDNPSSLEQEPEKVAWLSRPHFVLMLSFLKLLQHPQKSINDFTKRHLDYYYRELLQFKNKSFKPDKVYTVVTLEDGLRNFLLRKGTLLNAGKGANGEEVHFEVTRDFLLNNASVTELKSVFLDKEELDMAAVQRKYKDIVDMDFGLWPVLQLVYGSPNPGDDLPAYWNGKVVDRLFLDTLQGLTNTIDSVSAQVGLNILDFKVLFHLKSTAGANDSELWNTVDYLLSKAGQTKKTNPQFTISGTKKENFDLQLKAAMDPVTLPSNFKSLDDYYQWCVQLENYFFMPIEDLGFLISIRDTLVAKNRVDDETWKKLFDLLIAAYTQKEITERKHELRVVREKKGFDALMEYALGDPLEENSLPAYPKTLKQIYADLDNLRHQAYLQDELFLSVKDFSTLMELDISNTPDDAWQPGYDVLERAMRAKRNITTETPTIKEWYNLYKAEDASLVRTSDASLGWKPFGVPQKMVETEIGIVISSPILALEEGKRVIEVKLIFDLDNFDAKKIEKSLQNNASPPFSIKLSSGVGFVTVKPKNVLFSLTDQKEGDRSFKVIGIKVLLSERDPAVKIIDNNTDLYNHSPSLKITLNSAQDGRKAKVPYPLYKNLQLVRSDLQVSVEGIKGLILENDNGDLNIKKPFEPFGNQPQVGSRFSFLNKEIVKKRVKTLSFGFDWMGLPKNMATYYADYPEVTGKNFTVAVRLKDQNADYTINESLEIFASQTPVSVSTPLDQKYPALFYAADDMAWVEGEDIQQSKRFFYLELNTPDFQHTNYPTLASTKSMAYAQDLQTSTAANPIDPKKYQVNAPYVPTLKSFSVGYTSNVSISVQSYEEGSIFQIHPFGVEHLANNLSGNFLPSYEDEGSFYIGLEKLQVPDVISLFFQFLEGSADPDASKPNLTYSYLTNTGWKELNDANILFDTTENLSKSGILQFNIPEDAVDSSNIFASNKHWLRIAANNNSVGINDLKGIFAQGVESILVDSSEHYTSLSPETITSTIDNLPDIKAIYQPYASFGGRTEEEDNFFYTRISERLRHKKRAISGWDYERLILQKFPDVYKAKALPVDNNSQSVKIVVIPDLKGKEGMNTFEPRLSQVSLGIIKNYLLAYSSPFAKIEVISPRYLKVKIRVSIRFNPGYNESFSKQTINKALQQYLSPWAFEGGDIVFGEKLYANTIINFLENQESVAYVVGLKFFTSEDGNHFNYVMPQDDNVNEVEAPAAETILVSANEHEIDVIQDDHIDYDDLSGIGYMKIELDFKVD